METPWTSACPRARILPAPVLAARDDAQQILTAAQARATELVAEAEQAAVSIRSDAREAGRDEGLAYAQRLLVEIQQTRVRTLEGAALRREVSELALAVARRVLGDAWDADPSIWARALLAAAEPLRRSAALSLRVAPASAAAVRNGLAAEIASGAVQVVEDLTVDEAGCVAVSSCGRVDGKLSTMLASFRGPLGLEDPA
ncbi:MAG TPA: FliH/SctL family protein [Myxococcaceae bacterium]|nr:FliH/SctL family protein [Myxococcaceae bacterium]